MESTIQPDEYHFAGYRLEVAARKLFDPQGRLLNLSSRAFDTLLLLVQRRGETLSKDYLMNAVWPGLFVEENNLNQAISGLRKSLSDSKSKPRFIRTISGRGYCFVAPVEAVDGANRSEQMPSGASATGHEGLPPGSQAADVILGRTSRSHHYGGAMLAVLVSVLVAGAPFLMGTDEAALDAAGTSGAETDEYAAQGTPALPTSSFEAYRYFLAARNAYYMQDFEKTWNLTRQAIHLDPRFVEAHYYFSYVNLVLTAVPLEGMTRWDHSLRALESAEKIIELAPESSKGYALRAAVLSTAKDWEGVKREVDRLIAMGVPPSEMKFYAPVLLCLGDFEGAIEILEANLLAEPVNLYGRGFLLAAYELAGRRHMARREYELGEELNPVWWGDTVNLFLALGRSESLEDIDDIAIPDELKDLLRNLDDRERVLRSLREYRMKSGKLSAESVYYSAIAAHAGKHELAVELMREALDGVWLSFYWLWLPVFDETRRLQSFRDLLADSGIVDYWRRHGWPEVCQPAGDSFTCDWTANTSLTAQALQ